jgi:cytidyltransferase-like protein
VTNTIALSGGFDPLHAGHINMINNATQFGKVIILLNTDEWLVRKKGFFFQSAKERKLILENLENVWMVVDVVDKDDTVCETLKMYKPDYFGNAGDRKAENTPELQTCFQTGIKPLFNLGNPSTDHIHSSNIIRKAVVQRDWGTYEVLADGPWYRVKRLLVEPKKGTSKQYHRERTEYIFGEDFSIEVKPFQEHQLFNNTDKVKEYIEVQLGNVKEADIIRLDK